MYQYLQKLSFGKIPNDFAKVKAVVSQLGLTLRVQGLRPQSLSGSSVHGILQARIPGWVASPFSRGSSGPRDHTQVTHLHYRLILYHLSHKGNNVFSKPTPFCTLSHFQPIPCSIVFCPLVCNPQYILIPPIFGILFHLWTIWALESIFYGSKNYRLGIHTLLLYF